MKRIIILALVCVAFLGCEKKKAASTSAEQKTINVFVHMTQLILGDELKDENGNTYRDPSTAWLKFAVDRFTAQTGIKVNLTGYSSDGAQIKSMLQVEDPGLDIFTTGIALTNEEYARYTAPIISVAEAKTIYDSALVDTMQQVDGFIRDMQIAKGYGEAVTYNEEVLKKAGYSEIPGDLETFNKMLAAIKAVGVTPISMHRVESWPLSTIAQFADYVAGEPGVFVKMLKEPAPFAESAPIGKTLKLYTSWKSLGYFEQEIYPDFGVATDSVAYGKAAMMLFGSWVLPQIISRVPSGTDPNVVKFDAAPDFGNGRWVYVSPNLGWSINKGSKNIEESKRFIEFLAKDTEFIVKAGSIPTHKDALQGAPEAFELIDQHVREGKVKQMIGLPWSQNNADNDEVLKEANILADNRWAGLPFDALDITKPNDWTAFDAQIARQNVDYEKYRKELGVSYK
ncbi:MAG: ABC transporter substrate-binding protein [Treponema sp.]|jgi:ABC-type glycerol-3-phosphate transport system substrate-binding protein|nr:ABC transporter substrate-binding protein [Treponema sp.]